MAWTNVITQVAHHQRGSVRIRAIRLAWLHWASSIFWTRASLALFLFLQANTAQELPLLEPMSHAVLQQDLSTQQPSAALFSDGATSRHAQVPSNHNQLPEVRAMYLQHSVLLLQLAV
jgi:hypothetical protein